MDNNPGPKRPTLADVGAEIWLGEPWTAERKLRVIGWDTDSIPTGARKVFAKLRDGTEPCIGTLMPQVDNVGHEPYYSRNA